MPLPPDSRMNAVAERLDAAPHLDAEALSHALSVPLSFDDVLPWIRFDAENYRRNLVARTGRWELRLMCWRPGQSTSMHPHGDAACAFRIIRGSATETRLGDRDRVWTQGEVVREPTGPVVHQLANREVDALVTLHAYSPPLPVDAPSSARGHEVIVVGGGFAGAAAVFHLLARGGPTLRITWIENGPWLGRGIAYGVESPLYRLNVPAGRMSVDPAAPEDFAQYAGVADAPQTFCSRATYGQYVTQRLRDAVSRAPGKLRVLRGLVVEADDAQVRLADGRVLRGEAVVLATGLAPRIDANSETRSLSVVDAWDEALLAGLPRAGHLLVLGAGLTALDVLAFLDARAFEGRVTVVSRRGLLPLPHMNPPRPATPLTDAQVAALPVDLRSLVRWVRAFVDAQVAEGEPWQVALDRLRPHLGTLWRRLSPKDRQRFVRRVRPYWDAARHRAPVESLERVAQWRASGRLRILAGTLATTEVTGSTGVDVVVRTRDGHHHADHYDALVRCIGPAIEGSDLETPLVRSMLLRGVAQRDPAGLGIVTDDLGRVVDGTGRPNQRLFVLGALQRAHGWETTSVPEIAVAARALAQALLPARP